MTAKNTPMTDAEIRDELHTAFARARTRGTNWVDYLPDYIECDDSLADDVEYVGSLPDGRAIYHAPHTMDGFSISEVER